MRALLAICVVLTAGCQCGAKLVQVPDGLVVTPAALDFGAVHPGEAVPATVTLRNDGKRALALSLDLEGDRRTTFSVAPVRLTLATGEERTIDLEYVGATLSGLDTADLVISEGAREATVALRGETVVDVVIVEAPDAGVAVPDAGVAVPDAGVVVPDAGACVPRTCASAGRVCGALDDGCGGTLACGTCGSGAACSAAGQCTCAPAAATEASCTNGSDDDCDGLIDCVDPDCAGASACAPVVCSNQGDLRVTTGTVDANAPDLAFDGTNFGIAWLDFDAATSTIDFSFARMSVQQQLVGAPVRLTTDGQGAHPPRLAWNGDWAIAATSGPARSIRVRRFDAQGTTLGTPLDVGSGWPATIAAGRTGGELGLLWGDGSQPVNVPTLSLVAQGARVGGDRPLMAPAQGEGVDYGDLAWDGSGWAMTWTATSTPSSGAGVRFARVDALGTVTVAPFFLAPTNAFSPRLAFTGADYGVVWQQQTAAGRFDVFFARVSAAGSVVAGPVNVSQSSGSAMLADVTWTGAGFAAVWTEDLGGGAPTRVWLARLGVNGQPTAPAELVSCGSAAAWRPAIHFAAGKLAVAWGDRRVPGHFEIYARVLNP